MHYSVFTPSILQISSCFTPPIQDDNVQDFSYFLFYLSLHGLRSHLVIVMHVFEAFDLPAVDIECLCENVDPVAAFLDTGLHLAQVFVPIKML